MALYRKRNLLLSFLVFATCYISVIATTTDHLANKFFTGKDSQFDPNIDCDVAILALDYAKKLQPFRESFVSVYNALGLQKCNVTIGTPVQTK